MKKSITIVNSFLKYLYFPSTKMGEDEIKALLSKNDHKYYSYKAQGTPLSPDGQESGCSWNPTRQWYLLHQSSHLPLDSFSHCAKCLTFTWNTIFSIIGLFILAIGIWGLSEKESLESERITYLGSDPMLFFVLVGLVATSISLLGCTGALFESTFLLKLFTGGIMFSLVLEVLSGIVVFSLRQHIKTSLQNFLMVAMLQYQDDLDLQFIMDEIQAGLQCCGVKSYLDWKANLYFNCTSPGVQACGVPASCCVNPLENGTILNSQCGFGTLGMEEFAVQSTIYLGGCVPQLNRWLNSHAGTIGFFAVVLVVIEVGSLFLAIKLLAGIASARTQHYKGRRTSLV
ncbi:tetraspanin-10 [Notechis scutatus]|uniref:Tetraspanin-10 n=1 Tax=Notechis scutatus TaxID=8663 RepID=A0A6J1USU1_9SAUR|nr:tetraspanin-10 [Notechis scutatus]